MYSYLFASEDICEETMEAEEGDVVYVGDDQGTVSGVDTENGQGTVSGVDTETDQYGAEEGEPEVGTEEDGDDGQFEVQDEDDDGGGSEMKNDEKNGEKKDDNMLVVDELELDDAQSTSDTGETSSLHDFPFCCFPLHHSHFLGLGLGVTVRVRG